MAVTQRWGSDEAVDRVRDALGAKASSVEANLGQVSIVCDRGDLVEIARTLRDEAGFKFFTFLSAADRSELPVEEGKEKGEIELLLHLYAPDHASHVTVHVPIPFADRTCPSITGIFLGAIWHERECREMFGVDFDGHPKLVSLYLPEDFEGHPLLKSFKLPGRALVKEWPGAKDPDEAAAGGR